MTIGRLLWRNLLGHWRANLAVLLGTSVGAAVLTGALLVGDSLRGSLRDLTLRQLGWVDHALISPRFIRQELADHLPAYHACPAIILQGSANTISADLPRSSETTSPALHVGRVTILGVNDQFWLDQAPLGDDFWMASEPASGDEPKVVLNQELARLLDAREGSQITLNFPKPTAIPRETLLGRRETSQVLASMPARVAAVLPDNAPGALFSLQPTITAPRNVYIPLTLLQAKLDQELKQDGSNLSLIGRVNAILAQAGSRELDRTLAEQLNLDDYGLVLHDPESRTRDLFSRLSPRKEVDRLTARQWKGRVARRFGEEADWQGSLSALVSGLDMTPLSVSRQVYYQPVLPRKNVKDYFDRRGYLSLESRQLLLDSESVRAALVAAETTNFHAAPNLVYVADKISDGKQSTSYAIVASLVPTIPLTKDPAFIVTPEDSDIRLLKTSPPILSGKPGDIIKLDYYDPENEGELRTAEFELAGLISPDSSKVDPFLTPEFPGITDRTTIDQWNPPAQIHFNNKRVKKPDDELFWDEFRTTPKAFVTLKRAEELWGKSRFGKYTSIRLTPITLFKKRLSEENFEERFTRFPKEELQEIRRRWRFEDDLSVFAKEYRLELLRQLRPDQAGLVFDPVARRRLEASRGGQDFGFLFLGFSTFLIAAGLLLVGLLFRLNLDRRAGEIGLFMAAGFTKKKVRRLMLAEGAILAAVGGIGGLIGAVSYAGLLLRFLRAWWPGGLGQTFLSLHATNFQSFAVGYLASLIVSVLTIAWAVRVLGKSTPRQLLAGQISESSDVIEGFSAKRRKWSWWVAGFSTIAALGLAFSGPWMPQGEMRAMTFFTSGMLLLVAVLAVAWALLRREGGTSLFRPFASSAFRSASISGRFRVASLGARNIPRQPIRSMLTLGLMASATFLLVAVRSFHRQPEDDFLKQDSGSGGCVLLAETDVPIFQDLSNEKSRRDQFGIRDPGQLLEDVTFYPFRLKSGDDASCLNLYEARKPRMLGVPIDFIKRGGFRFASSLAHTAEERRNPWLLLEQSPQDEAVPVFADVTTAEWVLHKKLGDVLEIADDAGLPNDRGEKVLRLRIVGLLQDSLFQSELLLSEANFLGLFPRQEGYRFFLIETPIENMKQVIAILQGALADRGVEITESIDRLRSYMAVENTYLLTFQALGGLGLLLGALGLAVALLRNIWERRGELALLRALGYRKSALSWMILAENGTLLFWGLAAGTLAALLAVAPHLAGYGGRLPWLGITGLIASVLVVGLLAEAAAAMATLRAPIVAALRQE